MIVYVMSVLPIRIRIAWIRDIFHSHSSLFRYLYGLLAILHYRTSILAALSFPARKRNSASVLLLPTSAEKVRIPKTGLDSHGLIVLQSYLAIFLNSYLYCTYFIYPLQCWEVRKGYTVCYLAVWKFAAARRGKMWTEVSSLRSTGSCRKRFDSHIFFFF